MRQKPIHFRPAIPSAIFLGAWFALIADLAIRLEVDQLPIWAWAAATAVSFGCGAGLMLYVYYHSGRRIEDIGVAISDMLKNL